MCCKIIQQHQTLINGDIFSYKIPFARSSSFIFKQNIILIRTKMAKLVLILLLTTLFAGALTQQGTGGIEGLSRNVIDDIQSRVVLYITRLIESAKFPPEFTAQAIQIVNDVNIGITTCRNTSTNVQEFFACISAVQNNARAQIRALINTPRPSI